MVTVYVATMGKRGLREVAELCYHKAHYAAAEIARLPGYSVPVEGTFFNEFIAACPVDPSEINRALLDRKIIGGLDVSDRVPGGMMLCVTEMNGRQEIDGLVAALGEIGSGR